MFLRERLESQEQKPGDKVGNSGSWRIMAACTRAAVKEVSSRKHRLMITAGVRADGRAVGTGVTMQERSQG